VQYRGGAQRELALVVLGLGVGDPGQMARTDAFGLEWRLTAGAGNADRVGREVEEELGRKRVVPRVHWLESCGDIAEIVTAGRGRSTRGRWRGGGLRRLGAAAPPCRSRYAFADHAALVIASGRVAAYGTSGRCPTP
jgi:hypothetical protein